MAGDRIRQKSQKSLTVNKPLQVNVLDNPIEGKEILYISDLLQMSISSHIKVGSEIIKAVQEMEFCLENNTLILEKLLKKKNLSPEEKETQKNL